MKTPLTLSTEDANPWNIALLRTNQPLGGVRLLAYKPRNSIFLSKKTSHTNQHKRLFDQPNTPQMLQRRRITISMKKRHLKLILERHKDLDRRRENEIHKHAHQVPAIRNKRAAEKRDGSVTLLRQIEKGE